MCSGGFTKNKQDEAAYPPDNDISVMRYRLLLTLKERKKAWKEEKMIV